jgi:hypothetical protein
VTFPSAAIEAFDMRAGANENTAPKSAMRITGSDQTGAANGTALTVGCMATLLVGANAVRCRWGSTSSLAVAVAATDPILGPYSRFDWLVSSADVYVGLEMASGSGTFEGHVWTSSGTRST